MAKRVLVPLDRSATAEEIVPLAAALGQAGGATLRLVQVLPIPQSRVTDEGRVVAYADQETSRLEAEGLDYLRAVRAQLGGSDVECVVRFGNPVDEILREADAFGADLIAVTTGGRSAVGRVLLGSVAEHVLRKAEAAVMLVRPARNAV